MHNKPFIRHVGLQTSAGIPVVAKADWPEFPEAQKPSNQSPYRTVLWFHREINNGVRILVEGRDKLAVDAYAKLVTERGLENDQAEGPRDTEPSKPN